MIITIDGPAGSGKSTLSVLLAKQLGFFCLNSGYLYRGIAYVLKTFYGYTDDMLRQPQLSDIQACFDGGQFRYDYLEGLAHIFFGNDDITQFLKSPEITKATAILAQHDGVRKIVVAYERSLAFSRDVVIEGRACGSVQFPHAEVKLYVTASAEVRAQREVLEQQRRGNKITEDQALQNILARDELDMNRKHDPLIIPQGAIILDSSELNQTELLEKAVNIVRQAIKQYHT